jgi:hypothetical protein
MIDVINTIIALTFGASLSYVAYKFLVLKSAMFDSERIGSTRFTVLPAILLFDDENKKITFDDPLLQELAGEEIQKLMVNVRMTIDLEQVMTYEESSYGKPQDGKITLDATFITFKDGSCVTTSLNYDSFDSIMSSYYNQKYYLV